MSEPIIALKIDVDSAGDTQNGIPHVLKVLAACGARATFYCAMGPDNSGKALRRIITCKGYLRNMLRCRTYVTPDLKTLLYGTLLPAPVIGEAYAELLREVSGAGHEIGSHGWDHVKWSDYLPWFPKHLTAMELGRASALFEYIFNRRPGTTAAPDWMVSPDSLEVQDAMGLEYCSDTRGRFPFYPVMGERRFRTLQIPTTLATPEELLAGSRLRPEELEPFYRSHLIPGLNVLTLRAVSGASPLAQIQGNLLHRLSDRGIRCISLAEAVRQVASAPACRLTMETIPGRPGKVALQGEVVP